MTRAALFALAAALSASAVLGCNRLLSEYVVENGVITVRVENSCALNGFDFKINCCSPSGCAPASVERQGISLGSFVNAYATAGKDYVHVTGNQVSGGSRIKNVPKASLFLPESCQDGSEGDPDAPPCELPQINYQTLLTATAECPNPSDTITISGVANSDKIIDLASTRAKSATMAVTFGSGETAL